MFTYNNEVQIFGLPRSGTNFLEWTIQNNFRAIKYHNYFCGKYDPIMSLPSMLANHSNYPLAVKHTFPSFTYANKIIIIHKELAAFITSYIKNIKSKQWPIDPTSEIENMYNNYYFYAEELRLKQSSRVLRVEHSWAVNNYSKLLNQIEVKFNFKLCKKPLQPKYYLDRGGANCKELPNQEFTL